MCCALLLTTVGLGDLCESALASSRDMWRKRICFLSKSSAKAPVVCPHNGGRKHCRLVGRNGVGRTLTSLAEAYPPQLCDALARAFRALYT